MLVLALCLIESCHADGKVVYCNIMKLSTVLLQCTLQLSWCHRTKGLVLRPAWIDLYAEPAGHQ